MTRLGKCVTLCGTWNVNIINHKRVAMNETKKATRREFLTGSKVAAGAAVAGGLTLARSAHGAGSDVIRIGLVGCGGRGTGAAVNCMDASKKIRLVAVADAFIDRAQSSLQRLAQGHADQLDVTADRIFAGFDGYQNVLQCDIDLILLVTPPGFRPMQYRAAVEAGKHIFMEKPVCVDAPGFRSVMETNKLADEKDLKVAVGLNSRHTPPCVESIARMHDGAIGELKLLRAYCNNAGVWVRPRQPGQSEMEYQMRNWFYFVWLCGDHIVEQHVHLIDRANWIKGDHPVEANGMGGREVRKGPDHGQIFDHHFNEFTYADGTKLYSQCRHIVGCARMGGTIAHGVDGVGDSSGTITGKNPWEYTGPQVSGHAQEHVDWLEAIEKGAKYNEGWFGATSSMTAVLGRMATYSGLVVRWDDAVAKGPDEMPPTLAFDVAPPVLPDANGKYPVPMPGVFKPY